MRDILNSRCETNVYVNSLFENGEAIELIQASNTSQVKVNVSMKENTTEETSVNDTDLFLVADSTGKTVKYITGANMKTIDTGNFWSLSSVSLEPTSNTYNVLIGTSTNTNSRKLIVSGTAEVSGVLTLGSTINSLTLPTGTKTLATLTGTETLSSKTLTTPIIADLNKTADGFTMNVPAPSEAGETLILTVKTQTLTNKTLSTNSNWNGNTIAYNYGGTGQTSYAKGDIIYASASNTLAKLPIGSGDGLILGISSGSPAWVSNILANSIVLTATGTSSSSNTTAFTLNGKKWVSSGGGSIAAYTEMIKLENPTMAGIADLDPTLQLKAGHLELRGTETDGSSRTDCFSINAKKWNGSALEDYDDIINILNPVAAGSTGFPKLQFKLEGTNGSNGQVIMVDSSGHCSWQTPSSSTEWTLSSGSLYPLATATNVLIGTTSNANSAKLNVNGNTELNGTLKNSFTGLFSFSFINGNFYNDASRTLHLEQDPSTFGYGYTHTAFTAAPAIYSDCSTYAQSTGTAIAGIGSQSNSRFSLYANEEYFMIASPAHRNYVSLGRAAAYDDAIVPLAALHIENVVSDMSAMDTKIFIQSNSSTHNSGITFSVNSAADGSGSAQEVYIESDSNETLKLTATDTRIYNASGVEKFRFTTGSLQAIGTNLISTRTPPTSAGNTVETNLRISGGNGTTTATGWGSSGSRYYVETFVPPTHTGGPFHTWLQDNGTANFGWSYGSTFLIDMNSSGVLKGASTWTTSDERIKEDIVNADTTECINIIKRLPLKQYRYKEVLRDKCPGFTQSKIYGWIAQDIKADPVMNYASQTSNTQKYYDKETNSIEQYEVEDIEIINKPAINAVTWGAISGLINIVEQQQAIIDKLTSATSFKSFRESL